MSPIPTDMKLYEKIKKRIWSKHPKASAYRSGLLVKTYKEEFYKKYGTKKKPYKGSKPKDTGLTRWFKENWKSDTGKYKYTSRYSVYRPKIKVTKDTPLTFDELTNKELKRAKRIKAEKGRVDRFRKKS